MPLFFGGSEKINKKPPIKGGSNISAQSKDQCACLVMTFIPEVIIVMIATVADFILNDHHIFIAALFRTVIT